MTTIITVFMLLQIQIYWFTYAYNPAITYVGLAVDIPGPLQGSLQGGTKIYIRGQYFSDVVNQNQVFIGPYPCVIIQTPSNTNLVCETTPANQPLKYVSLYVKVNGVIVTCPATISCAFNYVITSTPQLYATIPRTTYPGQIMMALGIHRYLFYGGQNNFEGTQTKIMVGKNKNSFNGISQSISPTALQSIKSYTDRLQVAGQYSIFQQLPIGYARQISSNIVQTSFFTQNDYQHRIVAQIYHNVHYGGYLGHKLNLVGVGLSSDISAYQCFVAGQSCTITSASFYYLTVQIPIYDLANMNMGKLPQDPLDVSVQQLPYIGGQGFKYTRMSRDFNYTNMEDWMTYARQNTPNAIFQKKIVTDLTTTIAQITNQLAYVQYIRGYFYAPVSGIYKFGAVSNQVLIAKISSLQNTANPDYMQTFLSINSPSESYLSVYANDYTQCVRSLNLEAGYYYMEIATAAFVEGFYRISLQMPLWRSSPVTNQVWRVQEIFAYPAVIQSQFVAMDVYGAGGYFTLTDFKYGKLARVDIQFGDSENTVFKALKVFWNYQMLGVTMSTLDINGSVNTLNPIQGYRYTIQFDNYRVIKTYPTALLQFLTATANLPKSVTFTVLQNHSNPISGTYEILINGNPMSIGPTTILPYNFDQVSIDRNIDGYYPNADISIYQKADTQKQDRIHFIIQFGRLANPPSITLNITGLTGGLNGTIIWGKNVIQDYSGTRVQYFSIPYQFLKQASAFPSLNILLNSIPVLCFDCSYTFSQNWMFQIGSVSLFSNTLNFALINYTNISIVPQNLTVSFRGSECTNIIQTVSFLNFQCVFFKNGDGSAMLPAALNQPPLIHVAQSGYCNFSAVSLISIPLMVTSITPSISGTQGGINATLIGNGFPLAYQTSLDIKICGNSVQNYFVVSNQQIIFEIPPSVISCASNTEILYNGLSVFFTFTYDSTLTPVVLSVSPIKASPSNNNIFLIITGSGFGTIVDTIPYLYLNQTFKYQMITLMVSPTQIQAVASGGFVGVYKVVVRIPTGQSSISTFVTFQYQSVITSTFPISGTLGGGYNFTISGSTFGPNINSQKVKIGSQICPILSVTTTQIICEIPMIADILQADTPLNIIVQSYSSLFGQSICLGSCTFTYTATGSPQIILPQQNMFYYTEVVTITASSTTDLTNAVVSLNGQYNIPLISTNYTHLLFKYPDLPSQQIFQFIVFTGGGAGGGAPSIKAYPTLLAQTSIRINAVNIVASNDGMLIRWGGSGLNTNKLDPKWHFYTICPQIIALHFKSITTSLLQFEMPPKPGTTNSCPIHISYGTVIKNVIYTYSYQTTPQVTIIKKDADIFMQKTVLQTQNIEFIVFVWLDYLGRQTNSVEYFDQTIINSTFSLLTPYNPFLPAGNYTIKIHSIQYGYSVITNNIYSNSYTTTPTFTTFFASYMGGKQLFINGKYFVTNQQQNNDIRICGLRSQIVLVNSTGIVIKIPPLLTLETQAIYHITYDEKLLEGQLISDTTQNIELGFDNDAMTYYSSLLEPCYLGYNFGNGIRANITFIKFLLPNIFDLPQNQFSQSLFQGSNDFVNWVTILQLNAGLVRTGWNYWHKQQNESFIFQYVRFRGDQVSKCMLSGFQVYGLLYSTVAMSTPPQDTFCDVTIHNDPKNVIKISNTFGYCPDQDPRVQSMTPLFGPSNGGTVLNIKGINFVNNIVVTINGVDCPIISNNLTDVSCTTGNLQLQQLQNTQYSNKNTFVLTSDNGNNALIETPFFVYADRWSIPATWGGIQFFPTENSDVHIPKGKSILYDMSDLKLNNLTVQGNLIFADEKDLSLAARFIYIKQGGIFQAGTEQNPFIHKLTINLLGNSNEQTMGSYKNKFIVCENCELSLYGAVRNQVWTQLSSTVHSLSNTIQLQSPVDWQVGEKIVIASTHFQGNQTQENFIASIDPSKTVITLLNPLVYNHYAGSTIFGTQYIDMRAQVGLLSRNIQIKSLDKVQQQLLAYGPHIFITGKQDEGLRVSMGYIQIDGCGKLENPQKFCIQLYLTEQMPNSFIRGLSIHHGYARGLSIKGVNNLLVQNNVLYSIKSHGLFLEDGIQMNNIIQNNLVINCIKSLSEIFNGDRVSGFWLSNPYNIFTGNHAVGSEFHGILYEFPAFSMGPNAAKDICPMGMKVLLSDNNVAHSNSKYGFRIYILTTRTFPCKDPFDESLLDPYSSNPAIESTISKFRLWKNNQIGFFAQTLGYITIKNFQLADNLIANILVDKTNQTNKNVLIQNCLVVGSSENAPTTYYPTFTDIAFGIVVPRTDGLSMKNVYFANFLPNMTPLKSCARCEDTRYYVSGGITTFFENITFNNIQGKYLYWTPVRRDIFIDLDGTLTAHLEALIGAITTKQKAGTITPNRVSLLVPGHCYSAGGTAWDDSLYCDQTITIRSIKIANVRPQYFQDIEVALLSNLTEDGLSIPAARKDSEHYGLYYKDLYSSWTYPFVANQIYRVVWFGNIDIDHMSLAISQLWSPSQAIILRFDYFTPRDTFDVIKIFKQTLQQPYLIKSSAPPDVTTCYNGQFYVDIAISAFYVCISGRNKQIRQWLDITPIPCENYCPANQLPDRQKFPRLWSNATQWPNSILPALGENVTIPYQWNLILDIDPPVLNLVEIKGRLIFDKGRNNTFQAHYIWVSDGKLTIGDEISTFKRSAEIILHGNRSTPWLKIDSYQSGNKMLVVTGSLEIKGNLGSNIWTKLASIAKIGDLSIRVIDTYGWKIGDTIVIGGTYAGKNQSEIRNISLIDYDTGIINFTVPLIYEHYGAEKITISHRQNALDNRAAVGLISRNIKIRKADDNNNWGCRIVNYGYSSAAALLVPGDITVRGLQIIGCGQKDTTFAAIKIKNFTKTLTNNKQIHITDSSIHDCLGQCLRIMNSQNINFTNNVIFRGMKYLAFVENVKNYLFNQNLMMEAHNRLHVSYAYSRVMGDDTAAYQQISEVNFIDNVTISNNLVQGSHGQGFVLPFTECENLNTYFFQNNTAGSCLIGFSFDWVNYSCIGAKNAIAYANQIGILANPTGNLSKIIYEQLLLADNQIGISLNFAHDNDDNTFLLKNSYIMGYSRPQCLSCYTVNTNLYCSKATGIQLGSVTTKGTNFPLEVSILNMRHISSQASYDFKTFIDNLIFANFVDIPSNSLPLCSKMKLLQANQFALDAIGSVYTSNIKFLNCYQNTFTYFDMSRANDTQCGNIPCSGPQNFLIQDLDGSFTGSVSQLIPNGSLMKNINITQCKPIPTINGYQCMKSQFAILQFQSIAIDYNNRSISPIVVQFLSYNVSVNLNSWKKWPLHVNTTGIYMRFWSLVKLHEKYKISYSDQQPQDSRFQIQKRMLPFGNSQDSVIISMQYTNGSSIQILVKTANGIDIIKKPKIIYNYTYFDLVNQTNICGTNTLNYSTGLIQFVVNGVENCQVRVRKSNHIIFRMGLDVLYITYINMKQIDKYPGILANFLSIDEKRISVLHVYEGSTVIQGVINTDPIRIDQTKTKQVNSTAEEQQLNLIATVFHNGIDQQSLDVGFPILFLQLQVIIKTVIPNINGKIGINDNNSQLKLIISLCVGIPIVILLASLAICCGFGIHDEFKRKQPVKDLEEVSMLKSRKKIQNNGNLQHVYELDFDDAEIQPSDLYQIK